MRDHQPIVVDKFNGLWSRLPKDSCPYDHFTDCNNVQLMQQGFKTRPGLSPFFPIPNVKRMYTYIRTTNAVIAQSLLVLDTHGNIFDTGSPTPQQPILSIVTMTDFSFVAINGRAYISPSDGNQGLQSQFIYVYKGDGSTARKAGCTTPITADGALAAAESVTAGNVQAGTHVFAVVYETDTGFLSSLGPTGAFATVSASGTKKVTLTNIPVSPNSFVVARRIVTTIAIQNYNGDQVGYQFFYVPNGRIADNSTTTLDVNFYDADLLSDASHLLNIFANPPAGVGLATFHNRLMSWAEYGNTSVIRASAPSEPEAIDQVNGLITAPLDPHPVTNAVEYRDVLYIFKHDKTFAYTDTGGQPATWPLTILERGVGTFIHGIGSVLDSSGANIDYLILLTLSGIFVFNGTYVRPELSWKIRDLWITLDKTKFSQSQICIDSIAQLIYINLSSNTLLIGDYSQSLDYINIRWSKWTFNIETDTIALINDNQFVIGSSIQA